jgi:hypothetical protein
MIQQKKRSWIPLVILLVMVLSITFFVLYGFFGKGKSFSNPGEGCIAMQDRGSYEDTINIAFISENYNDFSKFEFDSKKMMNSLLNTIPYNEFPERFNFFRVESIEDLGCVYDEDSVVCEPSKIKKIAAKCPFDYAIVLVEVNGIEKFFKHLRSSAFRGTASLNSADDPLVFAHEFAHLFAGLLDEYITGGSILFEGVNCDKNNDCPKFSDFKDSECYLGCVDESHFRSIYVGIMKNYWKSNRYGSFNEYIIRNVILDNTLSTDQIGSSPIQKSMPLEKGEEILLISYGCIGEDCEILEVESSFGYVSKSSKKGIGFYSEDYSIKVDSVLGNTLIVEGVKDESGEMIGEYSSPKKIIDVVAIPYSDDTKIEIKNSSGSVLDNYRFIDRSEERKYLVSFNEIVLNILSVI